MRLTDGRTPPPPPLPPPPAQFEESGSADAEVEWVYETDETSSVGERPRDTFDKVAVPRSVVYLQGVLLALVAVVAFILGTLTGGGVASRDGDQSASGPHEISGTVTAAFGEGAIRPDEGCVIAAFPEDYRPGANERAQAEGLRPGDPQPGGGDTRLLAIAAMGGAYGRANASGEYRLQVPGTGRYFLLFVSRSVRRDSDEEMNRTDLAQLGRYVAPATELLGDRRYVWRRVHLPVNGTVDIRF